MCEMNSPCFKCIQRSESCHSTCKDYAVWKVKDHELKAKIAEYNRQADGLTTTIRARISIGASKYSYARGSAL